MEYIFGHAERELRRLTCQGDILRPITDRLLRNAGIRQGMRVLDLGCGVGDLSMLAAELVGPSGSVVGIDRSPDVIAVARERAREAGLRQLAFAEAPVEDYSDPGPFDLAIGRCVLVHQADPVALIRAAAGFVRLGGVVAFHEMNFYRMHLQSLPVVSLWQQIGEWLEKAFEDGLPHGDAGGRLIEHFASAGLPQPNLTCEAPVGGGNDSPLYPWLSETIESLLPQLFRLRILTADAYPLETLGARLKEAVVNARSQIVGPVQFCAWTRV